MQLTIGVELASVRTHEEIQSELVEMKPSLAERYHVSTLGIFGSYVRVEQTNESDLDILVEFDEPVSLLDLVRLENEITDELGVEVDLVTKESLKPRIRARVSDDVVYV